MKQALRTVARPFWWLTRPLRRPLVAKSNNHISQLVSNVIQEHALGPILPRLDAQVPALERIESSVQAARAVGDAHAAETNLLLDSLVREVARLQMQVESLREAIGEIALPERLTLVAASDDDDDLAAESDERLKAG
jgi:hypothetical protein